MQFDLMYYLHMSLSDFENNDSRENEWLYSKLVERKTEEIKVKKQSYERQ